MNTQPLQPDEKDGAPLRFLRPRDIAAGRKPGRSRVVRALRLLLPSAAVMLLGALVIWPLMRADKVADIVAKNIPDLVVENLHFTGVDTTNEPYSLTAAKATRPGGVGNIYDFDKPEAEMTLTSGAWVAAKAQYGRYDQDKRQLWLGGDVQLFHDKGYQFTSDEAQVDLDGKSAWGDKPVLIQGDFGEIRGAGFRLFDSGKQIVIKGPAKAHLSLHGGTASDKPSASGNNGK